MNYIVRNNKGISISYKNNKVEEKECGLISFLDKCAIDNLSTYQGRIKSVQKLFSFKGKTPLYINDDLLLFPSKGVRNFDCVFINYKEILSVKEWLDGLTKITFYDLKEILITVEYQKIVRQIEKCKIIEDYLSQKRKCLH